MLKCNKYIQVSILGVCQTYYKNKNKKIVELIKKNKNKESLKNNKYCYIVILIMLELFWELFLKQISKLLIL